MLKDKRSLAEKLSLAKEPVEEELDEIAAELDEKEGGYRAFVICRSNRRMEMLNLKCKNEMQFSFDYSHLYRCRLVPQDNAIVLEFSEHLVTVCGLKLAEVYPRLWNRRVIQINEADTPTAKLMMHENRDVVVTDISIEDRE